MSCNLFLVTMTIFHILPEITATNISSTPPTNLISAYPGKNIARFQEISKSVSDASTTDEGISKEFMFCKTNLTARNYVTYMMRLHLCSFVEGRNLVEAECRNTSNKLILETYEYFELVHLKFCNEEAFNAVCGWPSLVREERYSTAGLIKWWITYNNLTMSTALSEEKNKIDHRTMRVSVSKSFCRQISAYFKTLADRYEPAWSNPEMLKNSNRNKTFDFSQPFENPKYQERSVRAPFGCLGKYQITCGFTLSDRSNSTMSGFDCFPEPCKRAAVITIAFYSLLSVIITSANVLVLLVAAKSDVLRNNQGYFKIHLAFADLMLGIIVLPGIVYHQYDRWFRPLDWVTVDNFWLSPKSTFKYSAAFSSAMGVFTSLSLSLSVLTLSAASFDRLIAIRKPIDYSLGKFNNWKRLLFILAAIWAVALFTALLPLSTKRKFSYISSDIFFSPDFWMFVVCGAVLFLTLIVTWILNGFVLFYAMKHFKRRRQRILCTGINAPIFSSALSTDQNSEIQDSQNKPNKTNKKMKRVEMFQHETSNHLEKQKKRERNLSRTLFIMVFSFTIAILPLVACITTASSTSNGLATSSNAGIAAGRVAAILLMSNSFWNFLIYSFRDKMFQQALKNIVCGRKHGIAHHHNSSSQTA